MTKDQELCQMEHGLNTKWAKIEDLLLKNFDTFDRAMQESIIADNLLLSMNWDAAGALLTWAQMKLIQEARRKELIPEQMM